MTLEFSAERRWRALGVVMLLAGLGLTGLFYRTLPEGPLVYILAYVPAAALLAVGGILTFSGITVRLLD